MPASFTSIAYLTVVGAGLSLSFSRRSTPIFALNRLETMAAVLTLAGPGLIAHAHDQRRDHRRHCPPPPHLCGMGGHLRLRYRLCRRIKSAASLLQSSAI
jgi:hypothetical protein